MQKKPFHPEPLTKPTVLAAAEAAKLAEWLAPHVHAIEGLLERLKDKGLEEYDAVRFHAGWATYELKELLYEARKASGTWNSTSWIRGRASWAELFFSGRQARSE